jgi:hypothetical protein
MRQYLWECALSCWNGFQFSFPTLLSYIIVSLFLQYGHQFHSDASSESVGDLSVASYAIATFIGAACAAAWSWSRRSSLALTC